MKNFIIIALIVFVAWIFLGKKAEAKKDEVLGNNTSSPPAPLNPDGGNNVGTAIVDAASGTINHLIDKIFETAQRNNPPDTSTQTI